MRPFSPSLGSGWPDFPKLKSVPHHSAAEIIFAMSSPLVDAFTPAEREALTTFKAEHLQRALAEASGDSSNASTLEIWNIPIAQQEDPRVDVIIVKFLRAKYFAAPMLLIIVTSFFPKRIHSLSRL
jgi:hypothetical protein